MYVTRRLSMYRKDPSALSLPPPEGPNSGILVIEDERGPQTERPGCCWYSTYDINTLPFPQNMMLIVFGFMTVPDVMFIPVMDHPLSARCYYMIDSNGLAYTSAGAKYKFTRFFCCKIVSDVHPKPLDPSNLYQQFCIRKKFGDLRVSSCSSDGHVPCSWANLPDVVTSRFIAYPLTDALGLDHSLRECLPEFNFPLLRENSDSVVVGKWYCPFMFVKEQGLPLMEQMRMMFYEMTLKQQWVRVFTCCSNDVKGDSVNVDVKVETEVVDVVGMATSPCDKMRVVDRIKWFMGVDMEGKAISVGLDKAITEKIKMDQENAGWVRGRVNVRRVERYGGGGSWNKFGCYVLVEKYVMRRMNGGLVLTYEFRHTHQLRCKWE